MLWDFSRYVPIRSKSSIFITLDGHLAIHLLVITRPENALIQKNTYKFTQRLDNRINKAILKLACPYIA